MYIQLGSPIDTSTAHISSAHIAVFRAPEHDPGALFSAAAPWYTDPGRFSVHQVNHRHTSYVFFLDTHTLPDTSLPLLYDCFALSWGCNPIPCIFFYKRGGGGTLSERAPGTREFFQALIDDLADFPTGWTPWTGNEPFLHFMSQEEIDARTP